MVDVSFNRRSVKAKIRKKAIESLKRLRIDSIIFEIELRKRGVIK